MHGRLTRRQWLQSAGAALTVCHLPVAFGASSTPRLGDLALPPIGMGTWLTFNVGSDIELLDARTALLREFFQLGGGMIDCAPMYGSSADALGYALEKIDAAVPLIAAEKVWRPAGGTVLEQIDRQRSRWGVERMNLVQIHNLSQWRDYLPALRELKTDGRIDAIGITTSHGRRHDEVAQILKTHEIDFLQLTYNAARREAETRLLPLAIERGVGVIANRPFAGGKLIKRLKQRATLPAWTAELGLKTWADVLLSFIVSHRAVVCAIPATTRIAHLRENMHANQTPTLSEAQRQRVAELVAAQ